MNMQNLYITNVFIHGKHDPSTSSHNSVPWLQGGFSPHVHDLLDTLHVGDQGLFSHDSPVLPHLHNASNPSQDSFSIAHSTCLQGAIKV